MITTCEEVMWTCATDKRKVGKQIAIRYFDAYHISSSIEDNVAHCHLSERTIPE